FFCYTPFILVRSDWVRGDRWSELASGFEFAGRPVYAAVVYPYDLTLAGGAPTTGTDWRANVRNFLDSDLPGEWEQRGEVDKVTFWEWHPSKKEALPPM
ncbi:MAG TPA: hypothetical protein VG733_00585, partial [Chthoniobacteraceae bacterium]|nr:hypothetical protein [Chthoniobacteraceae bacterium]